MSHQNDLIIDLENRLTAAVADRQRVLDTWESLFGNRTVTEIYHEVLALRRQSRALAILYEAIDSHELEVEANSQLDRALDVARSAVHTPLNI